MPLTRRQLLRTTAGMALVAVEAGLAQDRPAGGRSGGPEQSVDALTAYIKLGAALDDRLTIWWMDGLRYGVVDQRSELMYGMKVALFQRFFAQPDGNYKLAMFELTYYTDLESGELLEEYKNPYTGIVNRVQHVRLGPEIRTATASGSARPENDANLSYFYTRLGPPLVHGDYIWITTDVQAGIKFPSPKAPRIRLNHYLTLHGQNSAVKDPAVLSAPASLGFHNILTWEPWMRMGDHPGEMMSHAAGCKLERVDELPSDYLAMAHRVHPTYIADPLATLDRRVAEIEVSTG